MKLYDYVFVMLVYRNTKDLLTFFKYFNIPNSKVIVVNSFFDKKSEQNFRMIANENGADFFSIENKGYGFGNNQGCKYALKYYEFKYLVISNADVEIKSLPPADCLPQRCIIAPHISTLKGKSQNPYEPFDYYFYDCFKNFAFQRCRYLLYTSMAVNKMGRIYFKMMHMIFKREKIYAAHGAFLIISQDVLTLLMPLYNERMFLFGEESHLAKKAKLNNIPTYYRDNIKISHKEDGSVGMLEANLFSIVKNSFLEYYKYWYIDKVSTTK